MAGGGGDGDGGSGPLPAQADGYDLGRGLGLAVYESVAQRAEPARQDIQRDEGGGDSFGPGARRGKCEWSFGENAAGLVTSNTNVCTLDPFGGLLS